MGREALKELYDDVAWLYFPILQTQKPSQDIVLA